jgi:hypothetical protein
MLARLGDVKSHSTPMLDEQARNVVEPLAAGLLYSKYKQIRAARESIGRNRSTRGRVGEANHGRCANEDSSVAVFRGPSIGSTNEGGMNPRWLCRSHDYRDGTAAGYTRLLEVRRELGVGCRGEDTDCNQDHEAQAPSAATHISEHIPRYRAA